VTPLVLAVKMLAKKDRKIIGIPEEGLSNLKAALEGTLKPFVLGTNTISLQHTRFFEAHSLHRARLVATILLAAGIVAMNWSSVWYDLPSWPTLRPSTNTV
jgi:hypothetical protein